AFSGGAHSVGRSGAGAGGGFEHAAVVGFVMRDHVLGAKPAARVFAGALADFSATVGARKNFDGVAARRGDVARFHEVTVDAVLHNVRHASRVCADHGHFAGHGFESSEAEGLEVGRKQEKIGYAELFVD